MTRPTHSNLSSKTACKSSSIDDVYCVVLGGGGARGLAHFGAMQALSEGRLTINRLVGVSMGSLIAGLCAVEGDAVQAQRRAMDFLQSRSGQKLRSLVLSNSKLSANRSGLRFGAKLFRELRKKKALARAIRSQSLLPSTILREMIHALIPDIDIQDLPIPLQIATVDLHSGQRVVLESGPLRRAIRASMSIPGVFPAVHHEGKLLSDIGVYNSVPCDITAALPSTNCGTEFIIAVDVGHPANEHVQCDTALDCMLRFQSLAEQAIRQQSVALADWVVRPNFPRTEWFDFRDPEPIIQAGFLAAADLFPIQGDANPCKPLTNLRLEPAACTGSLYG